MEQERLVTPNEIVAYNLRRARDLRGWTQEAAAERLEPWLGVRWTGPSFSVAERSTPKPGQKVRQFGVDDLIAFARAFELPVGFFLVAPAEAGVVRLPGQGLPIDAYRSLVSDPSVVAREVADVEEQVRDLVEAAKALQVAFGVDVSKAQADLDKLAARVAEAKPEAKSAAKGVK